MKITISKNFNQQELADFFELAFESLLEDPDNQEIHQTLSEWFDIAQLDKFLKHGVLIEARADDRLVGAVIAGKQHSLAWPDGRKIEIVILAVHPGFRQQGIASKLMVEVENYALEMQAKSLIVNTHVDMTEVQNFYKKLGFSEMGTLKNYYDNGDAVFLIKNLNE